MPHGSGGSHEFLSVDEIRPISPLTALATFRLTFTGVLNGVQSMAGMLMFVKQVPTSNPF
jgi:hypothetical protein